MDFSFSLNWVFGIITLACAIFLFQMLVDYSKCKSQISPQLQHAKDIKSRHEEEIEKVVRLTGEAELQLADLKHEIVGLEEKITELDEQIQILEDGR